MIKILLIKIIQMKNLKKKIKQERNKRVIKIDSKTAI